MSLTSRDSLATLVEQLQPNLQSGGLKLAQELFAALKVIDENGALRRSISDPTVEAQRRQSLVAKVFGQQISTQGQEVLQTLAGQRWSEERQLSDAIERFGVEAIATSAEAQGLAGLQKLTEELLSFNSVVEDSHEVQRALSDLQAPATARGALAVKLTGANASEEAKVAVRQVAEQPRGAKPVDLVRKFADAVVARQSRWIADVTVARPLAQSQQDRLAAGLESAFGRKLALNVEVDPQLVGGIRVQVGDEVLDSSIAARLNDLNTQLAG